MDSFFTQTEHDRRMADLICLGRIEDVDHDNKRLRVRSKTLSGWLPWPAELGRNYRRWRPLAVGQQVILASPSGDLAQAVIVGMLYTHALDTPSKDPDTDVIEFTNGARLSHHAGSGDMRLTCQGNLSIEVTGTLTLTAGGHRLIGPVTQSGGDLTSDGISVQRHTHSGVKPGSSNSGAPQ